MSSKFKPMLATAAESVEALRYPVLVSPKLDGIRCLIRACAPVTRNLKPLANVYAHDWLARFGFELEGFDGELGLRNPVAPFCDVSSAIMARAGQPDFVYRVFDDISRGVAGTGFETRFKNVRERIAELNHEVRAHVEVVTHKLVRSAAELTTYEETFLAGGYEGLMVRDPSGPYKSGRSTVNEGWLLKVKRFVDAEARVIGVDEQQENTNEATRDELGRTKRSSAQAGMVGKGTLGALKVEDLKTKVRFSIGTGFDDALRAKLWVDREYLHGAIVKYKSQPSGAKDAPRFPVFLGFRNSADL